MTLDRARRYLDIRQPLARFYEEDDPSLPILKWLVAEVERLQADQPQPDPIEAINRALAHMGAHCWECCEGLLKRPRTEELRGILDAHFAPALRAQEAIALLDSGEVYAVKVFEEGRLWWRAARTNKRHIQLGTWHYAENLVDAVLEAAEEET